MEIAEYLKKNFLDSCSNNNYDLKHRRKIIDTYKEQLKIISAFLKTEDESLKKLEN
jgi:hypothetical protein